MRGLSVNTLVADECHQIGYGHIMASQHLTRLGELMDDRGLNDPTLAEMADTSKQQIYKLRKGERKMSQKWATRLAPLLGVEWPDLMAPPAATKDLASADRSEVEQNTLFKVASDAPPPPYTLPMPLDVPIFGTAQGGLVGAFDMNFLGGAVEWAPRPPGLAGLMSVFAIYCEGLSMWPRWKPGDLIYVHKTRPASAGAHVVVVLEGDQGEPPRAMLKLLVRMDDHELELQSYNPMATTILPRSCAREILRVLEEREYLGL